MLIASTSFSSKTLKWENLPELPPTSNQLSKPGFAGAFISLHNNALKVIMAIIMNRTNLIPND